MKNETETKLFIQEGLESVLASLDDEYFFHADVQEEEFKVCLQKPETMNHSHFN